MATTIETIKCEVRYDLTQLRKDARDAEKIVSESQKRVARANATTNARARSSSRTSSGSTASDAETRVAGIKKEAQETARALGQYTPQIQRNFLSLERANNQVYNASVRSSMAIQKYGEDSVQAQRATNSLSVAVQNQSNVQNRLDRSLTTTTDNTALLRVGMIAATTAVIALGAAVATNLTSAVRRSDILANFPRVLEGLRVPAEDAQESINILSQRLIGLPTSLDQAASAVQRFTAVNGNIGVSTEIFLALNNAIIAGGGSAQVQATAVEQLSQAYSKGRLDLVEWRALLVAIPAQLAQVAEALDITSVDQLGEQLRNGETSIHQFTQTLVELNHQGANGFQSFSEQARNATDGIETGFTNLNTAITRSIQGVIDAIGRDNIGAGIRGIGNAFTFVGNAVQNAIEITRPFHAVLGTVLAIAGGATGAFLGLSAAVFVGVRALGALRAAMTLIATHPVIAVLGILGGLATVAFGSIDKGAKDAVKSSDNLLDSFEGYEPPVAAANEELGKTAKRLADIAEQEAKVRRDYRENLAQLVQNKNESIAQLRDTLANEQRSYDNAYAERLASFNKNENEQLQSHSEKTRALQNQIDFLTKYNNSANQQQLSETRFALERENAEYKKSTELRRAEFDAQTQSELTEFQKRRDENQKKLNEELALLNRHRADVMSVRGVILLDEIQMLKRSRDENLKNLRDQAADARSSNATSGANAGQAFSNNFLKQIKDLSKQTGQIGAETGRSFWDNIRVQGTRQARGTDNIKLYGPFALFGGGTLWTWDSIERRRNAAAGGNPNALPSGGGFRYRGGPVSAGQPYVVGENPDGSFNKTTELFIPGRSGTIVSSAAIRKAMGVDNANAGGGSTNVSVNVNMSGVMASGKADMRAIAVQFGKLINEQVNANTGKVAIQGI